MGSSLAGVELDFFVSHSPDETLAFGRSVAARLPRPALVLLLGQLGAGKTVLVKGLAEGLGVASQNDVASPSFTLIHEYRRSGEALFHIDLYRLESLEDVGTLGLEDLLDVQAFPRAVVAIEWGQKFSIFNELPRWEITLSVAGDELREIRLIAFGTAGREATPTGDVARQTI
jgi:tRNA threonylcarbamoyladenosine biosynthesis protein TsaE